MCAPNGSKLSVTAALIPSSVCSTSRRWRARSSRRRPRNRALAYPLPSTEEGKGGPSLLSQPSSVRGEGVQQLSCISSADMVRTVQQLREDSRHIFAAGVAAVDPVAAVRRAVVYQ